MPAFSFTIKTIHCKDISVTARKGMLRLFFFLIVSFGSAGILLPGAQMLRQTGALRGFVTDTNEFPIPNFVVTATSPALMGTSSDVTREDGSFRLSNLPPGMYRVSAVLDGFKTVIQENIRVQTGSIVTLHLQTEPSSLKEEAMVVAAAPSLDLRSSKITQVVTSEVLQQLPLNRDFIDLFRMVPGAAGSISTYSGSVNGASPTTVAYELDGVNANSPSHGGLLIDPHYDAVEEVEIMTGGLPAQIGDSGGSYVNIVTKSGGNEFHGHVQAFYTNENLARILFSDEQLGDLGVGKPQSPIFDTDISFSLGGPIIKDKIWFFADMGILKSERHGQFIPTTILGKHYDQYMQPESIWRGMLKFTVQLSKSLRFFTMVHGELLDCDVFNSWDRQRTYDSRFTQIDNTKLSATANMTWFLNSDTFLDFRAGFVNHWYPITADPASEANAAFSDGYTGYTWNGIPSWESYITRRTWQASVRGTHFMDEFLGGEHEWGVGIEAVLGLDRYGYRRINPLTWWYYNENPYYYREFYDLDGPHPQFGDGLLQFTNCGSQYRDSEKDLILNRWSAYIQDSFTIKKRLTINAGIRFDSYNGYLGRAVTTGTSGLPLEIGQDVLEPVLDFNPFGPFEMNPIKDVMAFVAINPRIGLIYDLFGDNRTALKLAYSRYSEQVPVWRFSNVSPDVLANYSFHWWDLNENGQPDSPGIDEYAPVGGFGQFTQPDPEYLLSRVDPDLTAPVYNEVIVSLSHELFQNFVIKAQYLYKAGRKLYGSALYDPERGQFWYNLDSASDLYVPFSTTVPAWEDYSEKQVTVYYFSKDSPYQKRFFLQTNIPESKRDYHGLELSFNKHFSDGWLMGGSIVFSRHMSFMSLDSPYIRRTPGSSPNDFVNGYGRDIWDQPLVIKLFGSFNLPLKLKGAFFYTHTSGTPYGRTVTVVPPPKWAAANNAVPWNVWVRLEEIGTQREPSRKNLDLRIEKQFVLPFGQIGVFLDVYNVLGNKYIIYGTDPAGLWRPEDANSSSGTFTPDWSYGRAMNVQGTRIFKFSIRFSY
jgi:hypothetical protein